jgi:NAD dependent epimerase/dehydratase family enzyme
MVVVAVAGGTGGVGRTLLDAIAKAGEHTAIVLSRTVSRTSVHRLAGMPLEKIMDSHTVVGGFR